LASGFVTFSQKKEKSEFPWNVQEICLAFPEKISYNYPE
jgi:hypothetical protein